MEAKRWFPGEVRELGTLPGYIPGRLIMHKERIVAVTVGYDTEGERDAIARLIAAAPEMLEALETLCNAIHKGRKLNVRNSDDYALMLADAAARKAIYKAKGE